MTENITTELEGILKAEFPGLTESAPGTAWLNGHQGKLDSLAALRVVFLIERHFKLRFRPDELTQSNFRDLASVSNLLEAKLGKK